MLTLKHLFIYLCIQLCIPLVLHIVLDGSFVCVTEPVPPPPPQVKQEVGGGISNVPLPPTAIARPQASADVLQRQVIILCAPYHRLSAAAYCCYFPVLLPQGSKYMVAISANATKKLTFATNKTHCD
jgi:hypothetical protein